MADFSQVAALAADLSRAGARTARRASQVVRKTALDLEAQAKAFAPVDTGTLQGSIGSDIAPIRAVVGPTVEYAPYQEFGTYKMAPHPFMAPAADAVEPGFVAAMEQLGGEVL